jgi:peroxiredoxin 2/4
VDGLYSHIAWLRTIKEKIEYKGMKDVEVKFPLIEDITMEVAKAYGMIQPGEATPRPCAPCSSSTPRASSAPSSTIR